MDSDKSTPILVTGATGYIGSHVIKNLLDKGYKVRGTVRSLSKPDTYNFLYDFTSNQNQLELVEADLLKPESWEVAARGCKLVIHTAGPNLPYEPRNADELIKPIVNGTQNVLNGALKEGVRKSVITSSVGTMWIGHEDKTTTEELEWTDETKCDAFHRSKILCEKAVMDFWAKNKDSMEIAIINAGFALGPVLTPSKRSSIETIMKLMNGKMPALPDFCLAAVDVRDVAEAHVKALFSNNSNGKRYIVCGQAMWFEKMASILRGEFGQYGYKITETKVPSSYLKYAAWVDSGVKKLLPFLSREMRFDNSKSVRELGMSYREPEKTLVEMGYSLIKHNIIPNKIKPHANLMMYREEK